MTIKVTFSQSGTSIVAIRWLTLSHAIAAAALFFLNASAVFVLKNVFSASDFIVSLFFASQFAASIMGSMVIQFLSRRKEIGVSAAPLLRVAYAVPFLLLSVTTELRIFIAIASLLSFIHAFSIPLWQSYFQSQAKPHEWRVVGAARKTLVAIVGAVASAIGGLILQELGYRVLYLVAAALIAVATVVVNLHVRRSVNG